MRLLCMSMQTAEVKCSKRHSPYGDSATAEMKCSKALVVVVVLLDSDPAEYDYYIIAMCDCYVIAM